MQTVIIKPKNPCAAVEFMSAISPLWLIDPDTPALYRQHPELAFLDSKSGEVRAAAVKWPEGKIELRQDRGLIITHDSRYVYADEKKIMVCTSQCWIGWKSTDRFFIERRYPLTAISIEIRDGDTIFVLGLELEGIWSSWEEYNTQDTDNDCDRK